MDARRVAQRYRRAQEDERALDEFVDHWVDEFLKTFVQNVNLSEGAVEGALKAQGVSADKVNEVTNPDGKEAGGFIQALGGRILHGVWHMLISPFLNIAKFFGSEEFRTEIKRRVKRALSHEVRATRHMLEVAGRLARGEEVNPQERKAAMHQLVDIVTKTVAIYFAGPHIAHFFAGGIWKVLGMIASPVDEILVILLDKPLRIAAKKLLGADIGLLPSGFYTHFDK
jgi:hypothetical protein